MSTENLGNVDLDAMVAELGKPWPNKEIQKELILAELGDAFSYVISIEDIKTIYYQYNTNEPTGLSRIKQGLALIRWEQLSEKEIASVTDRREAQIAWERCPIGSKAKESALMKLLEFSNTKKQVKGIYLSAPTGTPVRVLALRKLMTFFPKN